MDRSRSALGLRVALVCLIGTALAGCGSPKSDVGEPPVPAEGVVYESQGEIVAVSVPAPDGKEQAFIWEWIGGVDALFAEPPVSPACTRLLSVDLATRQTTLLSERPQPASPLLDGGVAVSAEGRFAVTDVYVSTGPTKSRMQVGKDGADLMPLTALAQGLRLLPVWSPDGRALTYWHVDGELPKVASREGVVITVPRRAQRGKEILVTRPGYWCTGLDWAPDGQRIYVASRTPDGDERLLEAVAWPALTRETLVRSGHLTHVSVARDTGDVIFIEVGEGPPGETGDVAPVVVWRLRPDGGREQTAATPDEPPLAAVVSPDGKRLAVLVEAADSGPIVRRAEALAVYDLATGTSQRINGHQTMLLMSVHWVYGGRALVFPEGKTTVRLAVIEP